MFQRESTPDDTTRRLSAATHHDQRRAQAVLDLVLGQRHRFLVHYDDIDTPLVVAATASAVKMWRRYCIIAMGVLVAFLAINYLLADSPDSNFGLFLVAMVLGTIWSLFVLWLARLGLRLVGSVGRLDQDRVLNALALAAWSVVVILVIVSLRSPQSAAAGSWAFFGVFLVYFHQAYTAHELLVSKYQVENWSRDSMPTVDGEFRDPIDEIRERSGAVNVTFYSGFLPFVGAGFTPLAPWRYTLEVEPAEVVDAPPDRSVSDIDRSDLPPSPTESQLMAALIPGMLSLDVRNLTAQRWHFAHGLHATAIEGRDGAVDQTQRPSGSINGRAVAEGEISGEFARSYLWLSSSQWGGELVLNTFLRLVPGQQGIFVEISHHVVPPVDKAATRCESEVPLAGLDLFIRMTLDAATNTLLLPTSLIWFVTRKFRWNGVQRRVRHASSKSITVDRGAERSIRDLFTTDEYDHYFQAMDSVQYRYAINRSILTKLDEALRRSGWAVAGLKDIVSKVNNTTIVGGSVHGNVNTGGVQRITQGDGSKSE